MNQLIINALLPANSFIGELETQKLIEKYVPISRNEPNILRSDFKCSRNDHPVAKDMSSRIKKKIG